MAANFRRLALCISLFLTAYQVSAAATQRCQFSGDPLIVGTNSDVILCTGQLPENVTAISDDTAVAEVIYLQRLDRCSVNDKRTGLHIVLNANRSGRAMLRIDDPATGTELCSTSLQSAPDPATADPGWRNAMPLSAARYIDVNGIRTRYFDQGSGPPLVLVHGGQAGGANNSAQKWEQNFAGLAKHFRVFALDRLAQAGTDNLPNAGDYADYFERDVRHLAAFVDALELEDVTLVGHSQGGWPVTRLALDRPDLVSCVVNVDTVMVPDDFALLRESLSFLLYMSRYVHPPEGPTVHSARRAMSLRYPSGNNITTEKAQRVVNQYRMSKTQEARNRMAAVKMTPRNPVFTALREQTYADIAAGRFKARSLVIWGAQDPQVPPGLGRQFNQLLADANVDTEFAVIEGAGHAPFIEFPRQFNNLLIGYCKAR